MIDRTKQVYEFRPDKLNTRNQPLLRYNNGEWIDDDGEYDLAFVTKSGISMAFYVKMPYRPNLIWSWCKNMNWRANVIGHPNSNPWHYMTSDNNLLDSSWDRYKHINFIAGNKAMSKACSMNNYANGNGVDFYVTDTTITAGLLRDRDTKKIIKPPKIFKCIYCGNHDWRLEEND